MIVVSIVDERPAVLALGAAAYLVKPVGRDELLSALEPRSARSARPPGTTTAARSP